MKLTDQQKDKVKKRAEEIRDLMLENEDFFNSFHNTNFGLRSRQVAALITLQIIEKENEKDKNNS